jgi:LysM repeat protein/general stress protein 26
MENDFRAMVIRDDEVIEVDDIDWMWPDTADQWADISIDDNDEALLHIKAKDIEINEVKEIPLGFIASVLVDDENYQEVGRYGITVKIMYGYEVWIEPLDGTTIVPGAENDFRAKVMYNNEEIEVDDIDWMWPDASAQWAEISIDDNDEALLHIKAKDIEIDEAIEIPVGFMAFVIVPDDEEEYHQEVGRYGITVKIVKQEASSITKAPTANELTYDGSEKELITAGETTGGTMQYAIGTDATTVPTYGWCTSIPTAADAGTYYVWYKVVGDSNHLDSSEACVEVTIGEEGEVTVREDKQNGNFAAGGLDNSASEIESIVLATEDQAQIAAGKSVDVWLAVTDNNTTVSETDKGLVENKVEEVLGSDFTVGTYLDLTLWKQVEGSDAEAVTEVPNGKVKVTIEVPENMRVAGATYKIIRIHNGVATVIDTAVDETTWKLTFETDAFSTYALVYTENTTVSGGDAVVTEQPAQADWLEPFRVQLHIAGELGSEQTVEFSGGGALPYEFMEYLQNHPQITLVYYVTYEGEEFTVTIPGEYAVADPEINWYGPLWLKEHFGEGANPGTAKANSSTGTYIVKKDDTLTIIAKMFGSTVEALVEKNDIKNKDLIYQGQIIKY